MLLKSLRGVKTPRGSGPGNLARSHVVGFLVILAAGAFSACSDLAVEPTAVAVAPPSLTETSCLGGFTDAQCEAIEAALEYLRSHSDPNCQAMGEAASERFYSGDMWYDSNTTSYGYMYTDQSQTYLGSAAFNPGELANTIAHEESHHQGYEDLQDGSANDAYAMGDGCAGPI